MKGAVACFGLILAAVLSQPLDAICPDLKENLFDEFKRYRYRIRTDAVIAVPYARFIHRDASIEWCLRSEHENLQVPDDFIGMRIPLAEDRDRREFDWASKNEMPIFAPAMVEAGFMETGPIGFLRDILASGESAFLAMHFDLRYFLRKPKRLYLVAETAFGSYEPKGGTALSSFRDVYGALLFDYLLHTHKRAEFHWTFGGGLTWERYTLSGDTVDNYTSQLKTGGIIRIVLSDSLNIGVSLHYRFNPDRVVDDSRLVYGLSAGWRF